MKTIEFSKDIIFDLSKNGECIAVDLEYRNFKIYVTDTSSEINLENWENYSIYISKYDVIDLLQKNYIQIDFTKILLY